MNNEAIFEKLKFSEQPLLLLLNKIDNIEQEELEAQFQYWQEMIPRAMVYPISALNKFNIDVVFDKIVSLLPESPPYYDKDTLTDKSERFFVAEIIREKILKYYSKEIPYSVEIEVEEFKQEEAILKIRAIIFVARDSQKGIIIGHKGRALNKIGTLARRDLETFFKKKIFLDLYVKVNKDWRDKDSQLKRFGYEN